MRVTILSANLGDYDAPNVWPALVVPEGVDLSIVRLTDATFPPRPLAMTSRLQCGIPKWFGRDFAPGADVILWIDASCAPTAGAVGWFLERLGSADIAVFAHPARRTVGDEVAFMTARMARPGETYLTSRYGGEDLDGMAARVSPDLPLYASTAFAYRTRIQPILEEVFLWKARHLLHDQLALPYVLHRHGVRVSVIPDNYLKCAALTFTRARRAA